MCYIWRLGRIRQTRSLNPAHTADSADRNLADRTTRAVLFDVGWFNLRFLAAVLLVMTDVTATSPNPHSWIISPAAEPFLILAAQHDGTQPQLVSRLRKHLTAAQAGEVMQQITLRRRAVKKFSCATQMFFTDKSLQQATDERTAWYKSTKFPIGPLADICCGIGGDLFALSVSHATLGVDLDPRCAIFARKNCDVLGRARATIVCMRAEDLPVVELAAWHADPDRRAGKRRASQVAWSEPDLEVLERALQANPNAGIKLAPAAEIPAAWADRAEAEWIGEQDECRQLFLRFGQLTTMHGARSATLIDAHGNVAGQVRGPAPPACVDATILRFVFEPHACVRAARLTDALAVRHGLRRISVDTAYLTGDQLVADALLAAFVVDEVLPFDLRRLKQAVRQRGWGRLEIKQRGSLVRPEQLVRKLKVPGNGQGVILLSPRGRNVCAVLAQRAPHDHS